LSPSRASDHLREHTITFAKNPEADRAFLRDLLGLAARSMSPGVESLPESLHDLN